MCLISVCQITVLYHTYRKDDNILIAGLYQAYSTVTSGLYYSYQTDISNRDNTLIAAGLYRAYSTVISGLYYVFILIIINNYEL